MINLILAGVGGQGTILASKILAQAAIQQGLPAKSAETIGMAQRGGCVVSHVRIGSGISSSMVGFGQADVIIGFEPAEAVRNLKLLKPGGTVVTSSSAVQPVTASLSGQSYRAEDMLSFLRTQGVRLIVLDGADICRTCGSPKVLNVALLGAVSKVLDLPEGSLEAAVAAVVPERFMQINRKAFAAGVAAYERGETR